MTRRRTSAARTSLFDGTAGPYAVRVIVRPPKVVPGLAEVIVRASTRRTSNSVVIRPVFWRAGVAGAPRRRRAVARRRTRPRLHRSAVAHGVRLVQRLRHGRRRARDRAPRSFRSTRSRLADCACRAGSARFSSCSACCWSPGLVTIVRAASGESLVPPGEVLDAAQASSREHHRRRSSCRFSPRSSSVARSGGAPRTPAIGAFDVTARRRSMSIIGGRDASNAAARAARHGASFTRSSLPSRRITER